MKRRNKWFALLICQSILLSCTAEKADHRTLKNLTLEEKAEGGIVLSYLRNETRYSHSMVPRPSPFTNGASLQLVGEKGSSSIKDILKTRHFIKKPTNASSDHILLRVYEDGRMGGLVINKKGEAHSIEKTEEGEYHLKFNEALTNNECGSDLMPKMLSEITREEDPFSRSGADSFRASSPGYIKAPRSCYEQSSERHLMEIGIATDYSFYQANNKDPVKALRTIESIVSNTSLVLEEQFNIELHIDTVILTKSVNTKTPTPLAGTIGSCDETIIDKLREFQPWISQQIKDNKVEPLAHWHLLSSCRDQTNIVGVAYGSTLCKSHHSGASFITSNGSWLTFLHEMGHIMGAGHPPWDVIYDKNNGIMGYGDRKYNGVKQFSPDSIKEVCKVLKSRVNQCVQSGGMDLANNTPEDPKGEEPEEEDTNDDPQGQDLEEPILSFDKKAKDLIGNRTVVLTKSKKDRFEGKVFLNLKALSESQQTLLTANEPDGVYHQAS